MSKPSGTTNTIIGVLAVVAIVVSAIALSLGALGVAGGPKTQRFQVIMGEQMIIGEAVGGGEDVEVGEHHRWEPSVLVVNKGDRVIIEVKNPRKAYHSFEIPAFGVDTGLLDPRTGIKTVEFTADRAGVFQFACGTEHDHKQNHCNLDHEFMVGHLIVLER